MDGKYVTLKLNTDYQLGGVAAYNQAMYASVTQVKEIKTSDTAIPAAEEPVVNYTEAMSTATMGPNAGFMGSDPVITITESQGSVNFASEKAQKLVQEKHGLGGMQVVAMAVQRDNYFAGIWANGCQWGSNHNLEAPYADRSGEAVYYEAPVDGTYVTGADWQGNPVDYRNWYYMVSDDNILITNCMGDAFSTTVWSELKFLYRDMADTEIPYASWNPLNDFKEVQETAAGNLLAQVNPDFSFY